MTSRSASALISPCSRARSRRSMHAATRGSTISRARLFASSGIGLRGGDHAAIGGPEVRRGEPARDGHLLAQVGDDIAGVRDVDMTPRGVVEAVNDHRALRRPPAIDRLLAHAGPLGDRFHRRLLVAALEAQVEGRSQDRLSGAFVSSCGIGSTPRHVGSIPSTRDEPDRLDARRDVLYNETGRSVSSTVRPITRSGRPGR